MIDLKNSATYVGRRRCRIGFFFIGRNEMEKMIIIITIRERNALEEQMFFLIRRGAKLY